jgi:hypothetical protein
MTPTLLFAPYLSVPKLTRFEHFLLRRAHWLVRFLKRVPLLRRLVKNVILIPPFKKVSMPVVRSAYPEGSINELVSVEPMRDPIDQSNYFKVTISGSKDNPQ